MRKLIHFMTRPGSMRGICGIAASLLTFFGYRLVREVVRKWLGCGR